MGVDGSHLTDARELRRRLHAAPELSRNEEATARTITEQLRRSSVDRIVSGLGGHGVAAVVDGREPGPTVLIRAELDGLPIADEIDAPYASENPGVGHKCGHDGHMAIVSGTTAAIASAGLERGRLVALFQPAEEDGSGAGAVIDDPRWAELRPDRAFALHNLPGFPLGSVIVRDGTFASASVGMIVRLRGETAHAAHPELAKSPALALAAAITGLSGLAHHAVPFDRAALVTVIHARLGEVAFGTTPGQAEVMATLRAHRDHDLARLQEEAQRAVDGIGAAYDLAVSTEWTDPFPATVNDHTAVAAVRTAASACGLELVEAERPFPWSEDFGHVTGQVPGALFGLGSGENHSPLHSGSYDFPDDLLEPGISMFTELIYSALAADGGA